VEAGGDVEAAAALATTWFAPQAEKAGGGVPGGVHAPPIVSIAIPAAQAVEAGGGGPGGVPAPPIVSNAISSRAGAESHTLAVGGGRGAGVGGASIGNLVQFFFGMAWTYSPLVDVGS